VFGDTAEAVLDLQFVDDVETVVVKPLAISLCSGCWDRLAMSSFA